MDACDRDRLGWAVQPLLDAGLELPDVEQLVVRLAFEAIVTRPRGPWPSCADAVADRSPEVRLAWDRVVLRLALVDQLRDGG